MKKASNKTAKNSTLNLPRNRTKSFHRPITDAVTLDSPDLAENPLNLYTLPYVEMIEAIADCFYPPNEVTATDGSKYLLKISDARIDRYILFRGAWEESFGKNLQLALRDITELCLKKYNGKHFAHLAMVEKNNVLAKLEKGSFSEEEWMQLRSQQNTFNIVYDAISSGFISDPGYGGNQYGIGWYYTNFMTIGM